jgi:CBS domain containing-hemolysin-like protein
VAIIQEFGVHFVAMLALTAAAAFCSCAEAAIFSLQADDRRALKKGNAAQRTAVELLARPDRLLTAILFWNLVFTFGYFVVGSAIEVKLSAAGRHRELAGLMFTSLLAMIVFGEMLPKTIGVQQPRVLASLVSLPLSAMVRALDPVMPLFAGGNNVLQRLLLPNFKREPYLEIGDLERAIELSTDDANLAAREQTALHNIVLLSELPAEEIMRPRNQYRSFAPPVHLKDLEGQLPPEGYLLITEPEVDEVSAAVPLRHMATAPRQHLEHVAQSVVYVPWCATAAAVLDELRRQEREVAAVVNEFGETIGIVTIDDVLETVFEDQSSRSARLLATKSIVPLGSDRWQVTGITTLRRISRHFDVPLEPSKSVTVAGLLQEQLQRMPVEGDQVLWSGFLFRVIEANESGPAKIEVQVPPAGGPLP